MGVESMPLTDAGSGKMCSRASRQKDTLLLLLLLLLPPLLAPSLLLLQVQ